MCYRAAHYAFMIVSAILLVAGPARSQTPTAADASGIWIADASGRLRRVEPVSASFLTQSSRQTLQPGTLRVTFAVESFARTATGALSSTDLALTRITSVLASLGIPASDVALEAPFVEPRYERSVLIASWEEPRRLGFSAGQIFSVGMVQPQHLGLMVDLVMGAGASRVLSVEPAAR